MLNPFDSRKTVSNGTRVAVLGVPSISRNIVNKVRNLRDSSLTTNSMNHANLNSNQRKAQFIDEFDDSKTMIVANPDRFVRNLTILMNVLA